jgi:hypothetical protein
MKQLGLLFFLLVATTGVGQRVLVSEEIPFKSDFRYEALILGSGKVMVFKDEIFRHSILAFNAELEKEWVKELSFEKKKINLIGFAKADTSFSMYYFFREAEDVFIVSRRYSQTGSMMSADTLIQEKYLSGVPAYYFARSQDESKVLIFTIDRNQTLDGYCIEVGTSKVLWVNKFSDENISVRSAFREVLLSDDGRAYFVFEEDNRWSKRKKHSMYVMDFRGDKPMIEIPVEGVLTYDAQYSLSTDQRFFFGGLTCTERNDNRCTELHTFTVDLERFVLQNSERLVFDSELDATPQLEKILDKNGVPDLAVREIVPRADGGLIVVTEAAKEYVRRPSFTSSSAITRRWVDYYFEDIVVFSFSPDQSLEWYEVLHKKQYSQDDDASYSSFFLFRLPAQLRLLYNDEIRNANTISEYIITSNGLLERKSLMSTDQLKLRLKFREAAQITNTDLIVPGVKGSKMVLVKISYEDFWTP